jgi:hypothetical protein
MNVRVLAMSLAIAIVGSSVARATFVSNGDFTANSASFTSFPGYIAFGANPATITDWAGANFGPDGFNVGINPASGSPFAPSGDDGRTFAFIQDSGTLTQVLSLLPSTSYTLELDIAKRSGNAGAMDYIPDPGSLGVDTGWTTYSFDFTTPATITGQVRLVLFQLADGDLTAGFSNVSVIPEPNSLAMLAFGMISLWLFRRKR